MRAVHVLNGPNLNLLGRREPDVYGRVTLDQIEERLRQQCASRSVDFAFRQSNHEGELVDWIHQAGACGAVVILNAGAYTHSSLALHDAIRAASVIVVEVHVSNVYARESFRRRSLIAPVARGVITGFGDLSYDLALQAIFTGWERETNRE